MWGQDDDDEGPDERPAHEAEGEDGPLRFEQGQRRFLGHEDPVDPKEQARRDRRRSNMDNIFREEAPERKPQPGSDLDRIFKVR